jgi:hypothetical protein
MKIWPRKFIALILVFSTVTMAKPEYTATGKFYTCDLPCKTIPVGNKPSDVGIIYPPDGKVQFEYTSISRLAYDSLGKLYRHTYPASTNGTERINKTIIVWKDLPRVLWRKTEACTQKEGSLTTNRDGTMNVSYTCKQN